MKNGIINGLAHGLFAFTGKYCYHKNGSKHAVEFEVKVPDSKHLATTCIVDREGFVSGNRTFPVGCGGTHSLTPSQEQRAKKLFSLHD